MLYALLVLVAVIVAVVVAVVVVLLWIASRRPLTSFPRYKFNSWIPVILNTGAVTFWGYCFVRASFIRGGHRAHEQYHHLRVIAMGRLGHLTGYLWTLLVGLWRTKLSKVEAPNGRVYLAAYYDHPEEKAARAYEALHLHTWPALGRDPSKG